MNKLKYFEMALQTPSNPSPFSAELQTFIVTKYDPLLSIVQELNQRLQASEKDRFRLERRVKRLEHQILLLHGAIENEEKLGAEMLEEGEDTLQPSADNKELLSTAVTELLEDEEALIAPWLFSCQLGTPTSGLQVLLEFTPQNTEELDVQPWKREEDMWIKFLEEQPFGDSLNVEPVKSETFRLFDLRRAARKTLLGLCKREFLLILRNVPGKEAAQRCPTTITLVAILAAAVSEAWMRVENETAESLGRVALVMEGTNIGTRLRAGKKRFHIEPLN
ncbi:hypothetical protein IE077_004304 [Cardiosporidium cionae]|uniref:Apicomplexan specific coiled coil protein n=1 Tax=Cardiosporidium cionae TaxID=476202 RepID=A0ABQ7J544_9APIC|nr:hypothetical protein IE077_004304 [Cardiosporidium cionae]|eukprot:KAF8819060.1 hypothetical protein IE077_004304 [Cardiosporidium cionae]